MMINVSGDCKVDLDLEFKSFVLDNWIIVSFECHCSEYLQVLDCFDCSSGSPVVLQKL